MTRWWDYIAVYFYADLIRYFLFVGFTATTWYTPLIAGIVVAFLYNSWTNFYCQWRLYYEEKKTNGD